jgi:tRNA dimethylallyltransferase
MRPSVLFIAGPTASGKSALAIEIARAHDGVVINADSMQVYADLRVITARPTPAEEASVPHRLFGHVDGAVNHSVGHYVADAAQAVREVLDEGRLPIVTGGTGLYFKALTDGLSDIPPVPGTVRESVRALAAALDTPALHALLAERDPAMATRLRDSDRLRVMRALEVREATGESLLAFQGRRQPGPLAEIPALRLFLAPDRAVVRARIDARFERMMAEGALDEVAALRARGLDPMLPVMRAHGVPGLIAYLNGELTRDEAVRRGQADTRAYAKRQFTWFRHQMPGWTWASPEEARALAEAALNASPSPSDRA